MVRELKKAEMDDIKRIQVEILDVVSDFCEKNGIKYWIDGGTLLGAIRHKGYIPWDDDIDVGMLRSDYDKFVKLFNDGSGKYRLECIEKSKSFYLPFGKVLDTDTVLYEPDENGYKTAINIDIFVYDNAPDNDAIVERMYNRRDFLRTNYYLQNMKSAFRGNTIKRCFVYLISIVYKCFPSDYFIKKIVDNSKRYMDENTKRVGNFVGWAKFVCDKRVFDSFIDVEFEGKEYKAPIGYDEWLTGFYGDYMQLPPEEKRVTHHSFIAYI